MTQDTPAVADTSAEPDHKVIEQYIEEEEGAFNRVSGIIGSAITAIAVGVSLFHIYAAFDIVPAHILRPVHVACVLFLIFLLFPVTRSMRDRIRWWDWVLAFASLGVIVYILMQGEEFGDRAIMPEPMDVFVGVVLIVLLLEGTRRATGIIMPLWRSLHPVRALRESSGRALDPSRLYARPPHWAPLHDARASSAQR